MSTSRSLSGRDTGGSTDSGSRGGSSSSGSSPFGISLALQTFTSPSSNEAAGPQSLELPGRLSGLRLVSNSNSAAATLLSWSPMFSHDSLPASLLRRLPGRMGAVIGLAQWASCHNNMLELQSAVLALQHFLPCVGSTSLSGRTAWLPISTSRGGWASLPSANWPPSCGSGLNSDSSPSGQCTCQVPYTRRLTSYPGAARPQRNAGSTHRLSNNSGAISGGQRSTSLPPGHRHTAYCPLFFYGGCDQGCSPWSLSDPTLISLSQSGTLAEKLCGIERVDPFADTRRDKTWRDNRSS